MRAAADTGGARGGNPPDAPHDALAAIVDTERYPLAAAAFGDTCRAALGADGALVLPGFLRAAAVEALRREGESNRTLAFYSTQTHNVFLAPPDPDLAAEHPRNRPVTSTKGCITDDQVSKTSPLRALYNAPAFHAFLCAVLGEQALFEYADPLSSINLHYASAGQELGWHFDNSSFAITLMIQEAERGGRFEYVPEVRDAARGEMNYERVRQVLDGEVAPRELRMSAGALALFRGRNAMHRVTPVAGKRTRMLVVLAYNTEPGVALSETARRTFYGRLG